MTSEALLLNHKLLTYLTNMWIYSSTLSLQYICVKVLSFIIQRKYASSSIKWPRSSSQQRIALTGIQIKSLATSMYMILWLKYVCRDSSACAAIQHEPQRMKRRRVHYFLRMHFQLLLVQETFMGDRRMVASPGPIVLCPLPTSLPSLAPKLTPLHTKSLYSCRTSP